MSNNINELKVHYRDCVIHAFGEMLYVVYTEKEFKKYWNKLREVALRGFKYPSGNFKLHKNIDYYHPWFQETEFGIDFKVSCFVNIMNTTKDLIRQKIIGSKKELKKFFNEVEIKFVEMIRDENILYKTLNEIDERLEAIKWDLQD